MVWFGCRCILNNVDVRRFKKVDWGWLGGRVRSRGLFSVKIRNDVWEFVEV